MLYHCRRRSHLHPVPRPGALWLWKGDAGGAHVQELPASFGNGGCARQTFGLGESYCLTHPLSPGEAQGTLN